MANYNKSFNFRNGVQVDEDDLIVRGSLVGIGTTIPRAELDVYGNIRSSGIVTTNNLYVTGIATFNDIQIGTGITIIGNTGTIAAKFFGDGAGLFNIPTSQWVDVDPAVFAPLPPPPGAGTGYTSIYAAGTVGIGTTVPRYYLQIGGTPDLNQNGVGIDSTGNAYISGILTSGFFSGSGAGITAINASNISSGTLDNARLPSNLSFAGLEIQNIVATNANISGIATIGFATITNSHIGVSTILTLSGTTVTYNTGNFDNANFDIGIGTTLSGSTLTYVTGNITNAYIVSGVATNLSGSNLNYSGISTLGFATISQAFVGVATVGVASISSGRFENLNSTNLNVNGGITTVGFVTASSSYLGFSTAINLRSGNIRIANNLIDTVNDILTLNSYNGVVIVGNDLLVNGISTFSGEARVNTGLIADTSSGAYLGKLGNEFSEAYVDLITIGAGIGNENKISTSSGDLILDSDSNLVRIDSNLNVSGVTTFSSLIVDSSIEPNADLSANLGSSSKKFNSAYINAIRVGVAQTFEIDTVGGTELVLNSSAGNTRINNNLFVSGIGSFTGQLTAVTGIVPLNDNTSYLGQSTKQFGQAYINGIRIGVTGANQIDSASNTLTLGSVSSLTNIAGDASIVGVATVGSALSVSGSSYFVGISTFANNILPPSDVSGTVGNITKSFANAFINEVTIGVANTNTISTRSGNLVLSGFTNNDLVVIDTPLNVLGITTFNFELLPVSDATNSIGTVGKSFGSGFFNDVQIGYAGSSFVDTRSGNLFLASASGLVQANANVRILGITTISANESFTTENVSLSVDGNTFCNGVIYVGLNTGSDAIILDGNTESLTVKDLIVTGTTTGVTASGIGITIVTTNPPQTGSVGKIFFGRDFLFDAITSGQVGMSLSPYIGLGTDGSGGFIGIGTEVTNPDAILHVKGLTYVEGPLEVTGISTLSGITTVTGSTLFTKQLNVSGVSTVGLGTTSAPTRSQLSFELISDTELRLKVRGTDGVLRFTTLTLTP